jgi:RNA polymerase sigma-70 factor (ECF subfamily)
MPAPYFEHRLDLSEAASVPGRECEEQRRTRRWNLIIGERDRLLRLARSRLGGSLDAEDCVHEALVRAVTFERLDERRIGAFLTTITVHACIDHQRRVTRDRHLIERMPIAGAATVAESDEPRLCDRAAGRWLLGKVSALGAREQQVMLARALGMSTAEAAQQLRISHKSAESAFTRARSRLRFEYDKEMAR